MLEKTRPYAITLCFGSRPLLRTRRHKGAVDHTLTSDGINGTVYQLIGKDAKDARSDNFANLDTDHHEVPYAGIVIPKRL